MNYCAPGKYDKNVKTCYTLDQLKDIARAYNKHYANNKNAIKLNQNKANLWAEISHKLSNVCGQEYCWLDQDYVRNLASHESLEKMFRPKRPLGKYQWLTTSNITEVMEQYEYKYPDFNYLGTVPIDFCEVMGVICNTNFPKLYKKGIRRFGVVFNTDPSTEPGKHWISMFINLNNKTINYFDSFAVCPPPQQVLNLVNRIKSHSTAIYGKPNMIKYRCNPIKHQMANSECGVYSIYFITEMLKGRGFNKITTDIQRDEQMNGRRKIYFRPN